MKSPAFQFYPSDYLGSLRVQMLTLEEEGAYIRLLSYCWQHGSIPADPEKCARLIGKGGSTTVARVVQAMFQPSENPDELRHDRLDREREKQQSWKEKSAIGGRKSAEMRAKSKGGSTTVARVVEKCLQPNGNITSPIPFPSPIPTPSTITKNGKAAAAEIQFPDSWSPERKQAMQDWIEYKKEKGQTYKPKGFEGLVAKLEPFSDAVVVSSISESISNNWSGLFPERVQTARRSPTPFSRNTGTTNEGEWKNREYCDEDLPEWAIEQKAEMDRKAALAKV